MFALFILEVWVSGAAIAQAIHTWGFNDYFNDSYATTAKDTVGSETAEINGTFSWVDGKFGKAVECTADGSYIYAEDTYNPSSYTISLWIKPTTTSNVSIILRSNASGPYVSVTHQLRINANGKFEHYLYDGWTKSVTGTTSVQTNTWYHVAIVAQSNDYMRLYVNGQEEGTAICINTMWQNGTAWYVGHFSGGSYGHPYFDFFEGTIDDVRIFSYPSNKAQIENVYQEGL